MTIKFKLNDVRCFGGVQEFDIKPLTFVVGENSTGKTTLLGCLHALVHGLHREHENFNASPYQMGAFGNIARKTNARQAKKFQLGFEVNYGKQSVEYIATFVEQAQGAEPNIKRIDYNLNHSDAAIVVKKYPSGPERKEMLRLGFGRFISIADTTRNKFVFYIDERIQSLARFSLSSIGMFKKHHSRGYPDLFSDVSGGNKVSRDILNRFFELMSSLNPKLLRFPFRLVSSMGPVRSQPKRNYDSFQVSETGDGSNIPIYLASLQRNNPEEWISLKNKLVNFGEVSGLFSDIIVREFGETKDDPLQLQFEVRGLKANIVDIGYGVSQILPLLVNIFRTQRSIFLIQQPEVHLHPTAQAEFTSLLIATLNKNQTDSNTFVIETHTDYMLDRARIGIRNGHIAPEDVSLIYLEPSKPSNRVKVHNITFDKQANFIGAPDSYGDFFMEESHRLLGFTQMPKR